MALILCPECNQSVSDAATVCPHCGYPIQQYVQDKLFEDEVDRLMSKIEPVNFVCPEPRALVCIKCGKPFFNDGKPFCQCGIGGKHFPGVEVDYPRMGWGGGFGNERFIYTECTIPMNVGDKESKEYIKYKDSLNSRIKKYEDDCRSGKSQPTPLFEPIPPNPEWFGEQPLTEEELKEIHEFFSRPSPGSAQTLSSSPRCPFCDSADLTKITALKKAGKTWLFGIFGALDDAGKTYKCNNCGAKF